MSYILVIQKRLNSRIYQHKYAIRNNNILHSGLSKHVIETGHNIREGNFEVPRQEKNFYTRFILESLSNASLAHVAPLCNHYPSALY